LAEIPWVLEIKNKNLAIVRNNPILAQHGLENTLDGEGGALAYGKSSKDVHKERSY